jgi:hypothetical protein
MNTQILQAVPTLAALRISKIKLEIYKIQSDIMLCVITAAFDFPSGHCCCLMPSQSVLQNSLRVTTYTPVYLRPHNYFDPVLGKTFLYNYNYKRISAIHA